MRRAILAGCVALASLVLGLPASAAYATVIQDDPIAPPTGQMTIDLVTVNGSGCPAGTAAVAVAPDNTAFTVSYSAYTAEITVTAANRSATERRNCQLNVAVHVPQGFTYAIAKADYRGYANLMAGSTASERANYYFQGQSQTVTRVHAFKGPMDDNWQTSDETDVASLIWAPCGTQRNLNINTDIRVTPGTSTLGTTSSITMDSADVSITTIYHFSWRKC
jgi:hypothetical protein